MCKRPRRSCASSRLLAELLVAGLFVALASFVPRAAFAAGPPGPKAAPATPAAAPAASAAVPPPASAATAGTAGSTPQAVTSPSPDATAKAAQLKEQGNKAFDERRYQQALAIYAEAYGLTQDPALLYNKGRTLEALGDYPGALEAQVAFDANASADLKQKVPGLAKLLTDLRSHVSTLELHLNVDSAEVRAGDRVLGQTGSPGQSSGLLGEGAQKKFVMNAGATKIHITRDGYFPVDRDITLAGGQTTVLDITMLSKAERGLLVIRSPVTGARVTVDDVSFGMVPTETPVVPGSHHVHLARDGYKPGDSTAVVVAGEKKEIDFPLEAETAIYKKWWFWTGVGLVVAGGVVLTYALTTERDPDSGTIAPGKYKVPASIISF